MTAQYTDTRTSDAQRDGRRQRLLAGGIALLLVVLAALAGGIALGRASMPNSPSASDDPPIRPPATGTQPREDVAGVGVGWSHSRDGAVAAATAYTTGINGRRYVSDEQARRAVLHAIIAPSQRQDIPTLIGGTRTPHPGDPMAAAYSSRDSSAYRYTPVGYGVENYTGGAAVVSIWGFGLYAGTGSASVPASTAWSTVTVPLVWADGDWKLDAANVRQEAGPTPAVHGELSSDLAVIRADRGFDTYAQLPR